MNKLTPQEKIEALEACIETGKLSPKDLEDARLRLKILLSGEDVELKEYNVFSK